jgi:hypothetical protein
MVTQVTYSDAVEAAISAMVEQLCSMDTPEANVDVIARKAYNLVLPLPLADIKDLASTPDIDTADGTFVLHSVHDLGFAGNDPAAEWDARACSALVQIAQQRIVAETQA